MQTHYLGIARCKVCGRRPMRFSGMCRICCNEFHKHRDLWAIDRYLTKWYPMAECRRHGV